MEKHTPISLAELRLLSVSDALKSVMLKAEGEKWIVVVNDNLILHKQRNAVRQFGSPATALDLLHSVGCRTVVVDMTDKTTE